MYMSYFSKLLFPAFLYKPGVQVKLFFKEHVNNLFTLFFNIFSSWKALFYSIPLLI